MFQLLWPTNFRIKVSPFTDNQEKKEFLKYLLLQEKELNVFLGLYDCLIEGQKLSVS